MTLRPALTRIKGRRAAKRRAHAISAWLPVVLSTAACLAIIGLGAAMLPPA